MGIQLQLNEKYTFLEAETDEHRNEAYKLRFLVPCIDTGYRPDPTKKIETDRFDDISIHFLAYSKGIPIGAMRIVPENALKFPMEHPDFVNGQKYEGFPLDEYRREHDIEKAAEIGRLVVVDSERNHTPTIGFYKCVYECINRMGIQHLFCVAKKVYAQMYAKLGFEQIGEEYPYPVRLDATKLDSPAILDFFPLHLDKKNTDRIIGGETPNNQQIDVNLLKFLYSEWTDKQSTQNLLHR